MDAEREDGGTISDRVSSLLGASRTGQEGAHDASGAVSTGASASNTGVHTPAEDSDEANGLDASKRGRTRPRVFPYTKHLPYKTESQEKRHADVDETIRQLYICIAAGDFASGAVHWTKELRGLLTLKFDLTLKQRVTLVKLYYELALAPGLEYSVAERFGSMFMVLTKRKHYLKPCDDLTLDWRPLWKVLKVFVLPSESATQNTYASKRNVRTLTKMCTFAQLFFDPNQIPAMLEEFLPYFSMSFSEHAYVVLGIMNLMLPTAAPPQFDVSLTAPVPNGSTPDSQKLQPQYYLPTLFHLWSMMNRSLIADTRMLDLLSRLARDQLSAREDHISFGPYGLFTEQQSQIIFTSILRILEIPVGQSSSPYSSSVDLGAGLAVVLDRDPRKHPVGHSVARWIVMSLSPECLSQESSVLAQLEALLHCVETFFHPSNSGAWTKPLSQLVYYLADFFVMRWNRENPIEGREPEYQVPERRRLNEGVRRRFVIALRDVVFMGIYSKSGTAMNYSLSALQNLAFLEPNLILPGALQRIYPAMQGMDSPHRTTSSIRALQVLTRVISRTKGWRCHLTTLLGLALPGVDANDLDKTLHSLSFIQGVAYCIPFHDLTKEKTKRDASQDVDMDGEDERRSIPGGSTDLAIQWITGQVTRFEETGPSLEVDYDAELTPEDEEAILKSSTAGFSEFIISFLGRVFTLLQNLPDAARVKSGSPEENVVNTLPAAFSPLLASLSPELYDLALDHIARFVSGHVVHQARDAVAFILNALVKVSPEKALRKLLPDLLASIKSEIDENGAGSTRTQGSEILPRDRALVWHVSLLSMCVVHVGSAVLEFENQLLDIADFMQDHVCGIPLVHVSNFVHHLLLDLTVTYTTDYKLYEQYVLDAGLGPENWGAHTLPKDLDVEWHVPVKKELDFALKLFQSQSQRAIHGLRKLTSADSPIKRDGTGKDWSNEVSRNLVLLRLVLSGMSRLFTAEIVEPRTTPSITKRSLTNGTTTADSMDVEDADGDNDLAADIEDDRIRPALQYLTGYPLDVDSSEYRLVQEVREEAGQVLHQVHEYLSAEQSDDVACFNALYTAYKTFFVDIGLERSAHVLDRLTRLLSADIHPFKVSGMRKQYPRPLLVRRANLYQFQRVRFNEHPRPMSDLDRQLLLDLALSSTSAYTDVRRTAQSAGEQAVKCLVGSKTLIIPPLLDTLKQALDESNHARIKGAIYSLLFGSLAKTIGRDWRYAPGLIRLFIRVTEVDRPSVQKLVTNSSFTVQDMVKAMDRQVILDQETLDAIWPEGERSGKSGTPSTIQEVEQLVIPRRQRLQRRRAVVEAKKQNLASELVESVKKSHWKKASRTAVMVIGLDYRFETIASPQMLDLVVQGVVDPHPSLRQLYANATMAIFNLCQTRALCGHQYRGYLLDEGEDPDAVELPTHPEDPSWTAKFLAQFAQPNADAYIDADYSGWLVWSPAIRAFRTSRNSLEFDDVERDIREKMGAYLTRSWFSTVFGYMKQEPRDSSSDRFRMSSSMLVAYALDLVLSADVSTPATFDDVKDLSMACYGDGSDKHSHRAMAEILGAMLSASEDFEPEVREQVWSFAFPLVRRIFTDGLTPENLGYWSTFVNLLVGGRDPRRAWPLISWLADFRLDMSTNAAFKESSKVALLQIVVSSVGWHFQLEAGVLEDFLKHLDHPYKGVREVVGETIATIFKTRHHESYSDVRQLLEKQRAAGSIGSKPYQSTDTFSKIVKDVFNRLETWRLERPAGIQTPTSYTQASKTVLLWLDTALSGWECSTLVPFFPSVDGEKKGIMQQLLYMMDIKEDPELQSLAYHVFRHLPNVMHRPAQQSSDGSQDEIDQIRPFVSELISIGTTSTSWHQRLRVLINIQVVYFRFLFLLTIEQKWELVRCVQNMLVDPQVEVRLGAQTSLAGMIRCSPVGFRDAVIADLKTQFTKMLIDNPLPKRNRNFPPSAAGSRPGSSMGLSRPASGTSTPTPETNNTVLRRHAAVLGLGALVQAFPYASPPPAWLPEVLATLAGKASADPGVVGKSVKTTLADFKKTRIESWTADVKAFKPEQLEDLEGVLWKSYFA